MQTIILYPLNCIIAIHDIMNAINLHYYELFIHDKLEDPTLKKLFQARQSILSWIIFNDGIGFNQIDCKPELVTYLNLIANTHKELLDTEVNLYEIINEQHRVA